MSNGWWPWVQTDLFENLTPWITDLDFVFGKSPRYYIVYDVVLYFSNDYYEALNRVLQCQTQKVTQPYRLWNFLMKQIWR